jgi:hypothetical protein
MAEWLRNGPQILFWPFAPVPAHPDKYALAHIKSTASHLGFCLVPTRANVFDSNSGSNSDPFRSLVAAGKNRVRILQQVPKIGDGISHGA